MKMPIVFFGHGSPAIALETNNTTHKWRGIANDITRNHGRPKAILSISAHWLTDGIAVTAMKSPRTIHDFGPSLPAPLFKIQYPADGSPELAVEVKTLLAPEPVILDDRQWGLDHGTWSVMSKAWPDANIPVVQLSLDVKRTPAQHLALAEKLRSLRDEGVLIIGTGNIVHNLPKMNWQNANCAPYPWAREFDDYIVGAIKNNDTKKVVNYNDIGEAATLSVPSPDHFWPILYTVGAATADDMPEIFLNHTEHGSLSMTSIIWRPGKTR